MPETGKANQDKKSVLFVATPETLSFCEQIANEKGISPERVLSILAATGENIAKLNRLGIRVVAKSETGDVDIDPFKDR